MTDRLNLAALYQQALEAAAESVHYAQGFDDYGVVNEDERSEAVGIARAAVSAYLAALPQDTIDLKAAGEAAVLDGEFYERTEWNNLSFEVQEQYLNSSRLTILNYLTALKRS